MSATIVACINSQKKPIKGKRVAYKVLKYSKGPGDVKMRTVGHPVAGSFQLVPQMGDSVGSTTYVVEFCEDITVMPDYQVAVTIRWEDSWLRKVWVAFKNYKPPQLESRGSIPDHEVPKILIEPRKKQDEVSVRVRYQTSDQVLRRTKAMLRARK